MTNKPVLVRMNPETREKGETQAKKLGLSLSEYIRMLINLDAANDILSKSKGAE